jgi:acyl-CoA dehydrogenase
VAIDLGLGDRTRELRTRVRDFIDGLVIPAEAESVDGLAPDDVVLRLRTAARAAGVFAPTAPEDYGGLGLSHCDQAVVLEEAGRSLLGPRSLHCAAPDEGNILLLDRLAAGDQRDRYLGPLARGEIRSAFAMTEPTPGAGSDPSQLATQAIRTSAGQWRIDGGKWLITGADGATFVIVMARTGSGATMFLVDLENPGVRLIRHVPTIDQAFAGGHCELQFDHCVVAGDSVLGGMGQGFRDVQVRLGPARLTHCMRWLGAARRAHEVAVGYAADRPMFGATLGELGMAQRSIAENEIDIAAARGLIWSAAWTLDQGGPARQETSVAKAFVAEAVYRVVDRSMQLTGGYGMSYDSPLPAILREVRPFRVYDGPTEVHFQSIARRSLRHAASGCPAPAVGQPPARVEVRRGDRHRPAAGRAVQPDLPADPRIAALGASASAVGARTGIGTRRRPRVPSDDRAPPGRLPGAPDAMVV